MTNPILILTLLLHLLLLLFSPLSSSLLHQTHPYSSSPPPPHQGGGGGGGGGVISGEEGGSATTVSFEEKARLGSTPPSCHNKCNGCHPCMAVQVSTLPGRSNSNPPVIPKPADFFDPHHAAGNRYSNYKPLGWKCRCGDHFYNP